MNAREKTLAQLRANERPAEHPGPWRSRRNFADLAQRFTETLTSLNGEVIRAKNLDEAWSQVDTVLHEIRAERVIANDVSPLNSIDLAAQWPDFAWHVVGKTEGDIRAFATTADIGLSGADVALAETGSIAVSSGQGRSRLASLLPPIHLALVPTSLLTSDLFTWTAARNGKLPANTVLVSGPSKTADIEQTLAIGVHGPKRFIVILYED